MMQSRVERAGGTCSNKRRGDIQEATHVPSAGLQRNCTDQRRIGFTCRVNTGDITLRRTVIYGTNSNTCKTCKHNNKFESFLHADVLCMDISFK